ncbi:carboxylating nicotinate-nucleotide diphosphorylase [Peptococcus simiae]|uniref:nicotinate-nucleotide diphosphorylase (carboxylating) n=1 Tax=Peptococcus simiae TaxID=1643805 RepID=A0ABW9GYS7_9FIRM
MTNQLHHFLIDDYILAALKEDINEEDISTNAVIDAQARGRVKLLAKEEGILAGLAVFERVFTLLDAESRVSFQKADGDRVQPDEVIAIVYGKIRTLLTGERVALNFLQRMSGIASYTRKMADILAGSKTKIVDTRKTTPNFRLFAKYAVTVGGGANHRYNLTDGVLLKDNHLEAAGSIQAAIDKARAYASFVRKIEVEVESLDQVQEALDARADIIMLDNMGPDTIKEAVGLIQGRALVELSGNINLANLHQYKDLGADLISSGSLTHSAPVLDLSMKELSHDPE